MNFPSYLRKWILKDYVTQGESLIDDIPLDLFHWNDYLQLVNPFTKNQVENVFIRIQSVATSDWLVGYNSVCQLIPQNCSLVKEVQSEFQREQFAKGPAEVAGNLFHQTGTIHQECKTVSYWRKRAIPGCKEDLVASSQNISLLPIDTLEGLVLYLRDHHVIGVLAVNLSTGNGLQNLIGLDENDLGRRDIFSLEN